MGQRKTKYGRELTVKEFEEIKKNNELREVFIGPTFSPLRYFELGDHELIFERTSPLINRVEYSIIYDRHRYYDNLKRMEDMNNAPPYGCSQELIKTLPSSTHEILEDFFQKINFQRPAKLSEINIKKLQLKINAYNKDRAYYDLTIGLIVFCGEYLREKRGGHWEVKEARSLKGMYLSPSYVDQTGRDYDFWINGAVVGWFKKWYRGERANTSISEILTFASRPEIGVFPSK
jgi:hypothetical protein